MKNCIKVLSIALALLLIVGCASKNQDINAGTVNEAVADNSTSKSIAVSKETSDIVETTTSEDVTLSESNSVAPNSAEKTQTPAQNSADRDNKTLEGFTVCVDAGHGQTTRAINKKEPIAPGSEIMKAAIASGTSGVYTKISEASLNLTVSKKLKEALAKKGARIIMIRETSTCDLTNVERTELWNSSSVDLTIRIHANGINDSKVSGVLMMIPGDKYIKDKEILEKSEQAGQYILDDVLKHTQAKSRGMIKSTELTGFNWSKVPVVLLEMGFMTNPQEDKLLNTESYQDKIVLGIVEGLEKYRSNLN